MKYCIMASLSFDTPAKRDGLASDIKTFIGAKHTWGETILNSANDEKGKPTHITEVRFQVKANMSDLFIFIKDKMLKIPVLKGTVSKHNCPHDEGGKPCVLEEEFKK